MKQLLFQILPCIARTRANIHIFRSRNSSHFIKFCPWKEQILEKPSLFSLKTYQIWNPRWQLQNWLCLQKDSNFQLFYSHLLLFPSPMKLNIENYFRILDINIITWSLLVIKGLSLLCGKLKLMNKSQLYK